MSIRLMVLTAVILVGVATVQSVDGQSEPRTIEGRVVNATDGGADVSGQPVTLHRVGTEGFEDLSTTTDDSGAFRFESVEYDPASGYGVSVRYQHAIYGTDLDLSSGSPEPVTLTVYNATHDDTVVSTVSASLLLAAVDEAEQMLAALEIIRLANRSEETYVPGSGVMELLRFGLPPGAVELTLDTRLIAADFVQVDRGFALLASVPPGEHELMYSYSFPYERGSYVLEKTYRYGADSLRILAAEEVLSLSSEDLGSPEVVRIGERDYRVLETEGLTRGARVVLNLEDLPMASAGQRLGTRFSDIRFEYAGPVALVVLMIVLLIYGSVWRSDRRSRGAD